MKISGKDSWESKEYVKYSQHISLPVGMCKVLKKYNPTFQILKMEDFNSSLRFNLPKDLSNLSCYSAVFGNLNNDGVFDSVLFGEVSASTDEVKYFPVLGVLSQGATSYRVVEITRVQSEKPLSTHLSIARRRIKCGPDVHAIGGLLSPPMLDTVLINAESGVVEYYWDENTQSFKENQVNTQ